jgi:hypothetical protein
LLLERFKNLNPIGRMSDKPELRGGIVFNSDASSHVVGHNFNHRWWLNHGTFFLNTYKHEPIYRNFQEEIGTDYPPLLLLK